MKRCSWCNALMIPLTGKSEGGTMHRRCAQYVAAITAENQQQYMPPDPSQSYSYEDFLGRLEDEDGGW